MFLLLFLLSLVLPSHAGIYLGALGGHAEDDGKGIEKLQGSTFSGKVGWRWSWVALEFSQTRYDMKTEPGQADGFYVQKAKLYGTSNDYNLRFIPFRFLSFAVGATTLNLKDDIVLTNIGGDPTKTLTEKGDSFYTTGHVFSVAIHIPLGAGFEIWGEVLKRTWTSILDSSLVDVPDLNLIQWQAGLVWHWGSGKKKKKKVEQERAYLF